MLFATVTCGPARAAEKPNLIVIDIDNLGYAGMGIMVGEVTSTRALAQVRLTQTDELVDDGVPHTSGDVPGAVGLVEFSIEGEAPVADESIGRRVFPPIEATPDRDFMARIEFTRLKPGTRYVVRTRIGRTTGDLRPGPTATFRTLPGPKRSDQIRFVVVTGMNYAKFHGDDHINRNRHWVENNTALPASYAGPDKHLGYPALASILALKPDFFVGTGDNVYYDTPTKPRAETIPQLRQKWHEQFVQPRYRDLFAAVPTYWMIDDHDYRIDDCDNTGDYDPSPEVGRRMMLEQLPVVPVAADDDDVKTYRTHRVSRDLQIWFPENRMYRSPNVTPDGPEKTIWGAEQKAWLKRTLAASDATFKLLISPNPMIGPDDARKTDNHTNIGGFQHERDEFFAWLKETGVAGNFSLVCGDRHWQYHSIHPSGIEEFSCGALVDANSRPGRKPGDPKGTDPQGLIQQVYSQKTPSGGFLLVDASPAHGDRPPMLTFRFHDEQGMVLYEHRKTGAMSRNQ